MSGPGAIVPRGPSGVELSTAQARVELAAARERARATLAALEQRFKGVGDWRGTARRHPLLALGGAFLVGYALGRIFTRR